MRHLVLWNPNAAAGRADALEPRLRAVLEAAETAQFLVVAVAEVEIPEAVEEVVLGLQAPALEAVADLAL